MSVAALVDSIEELAMSPLRCGTLHYEWLPVAMMVVGCTCLHDGQHALICSEHIHNGAQITRSIQHVIVETLHYFIHPPECLYPVVH